MFKTRALASPRPIQLRERKQRSARDLTYFFGAMNRYPRRGRVSTKRGFSDESPSASRILLIAVFRL
jgi:hypothetical protein